MEVRPGSWLPPQALGLLTGVIALAAVSASWVGHADVGDADLYRVIARNMVQDQTWTRLRYVPGAHTPFFEHLPFGFWPFAWSLKWLGEAGPNAVSALLSLGALGTVYLGIRRLGAPLQAGLLGVLVLALTGDFLGRAGHPYLDQPLMFFATAAVLPILPGGRTGVGGWLTSLACLTAAIATKGPFGALPFVGVIAARTFQERRWQWALSGAGVLLLAAVPPALFVLLRPEWLEGFGRHQLLASATGARVDGQLSIWFPLRAIAGHFWPGLALLPAAIWAARSPAARNARLLGLGTALAVAALCLPSRKVWSHVLVVFPLGAMFIGVAAGPFLEARFQSARFRRVTQWGLAGLALLAVGFAALGGGRMSLPRQCALSSDFAAEVARFRKGERVLVVDDTFQWGMLSSLASHYPVVPVLVRPENRAAMLEAYGDAEWMLTTEAGCTPEAQWRRVKDAAGWRLCARAEPAR